MTSLESLKKEIIETIEIYRKHKDAAPFIGGTYLSSSTRTLVVSYVAEIDGYESLLYENQSDRQVPYSYYMFSPANSDFSYPEKSYPTRVIMGTNSSSFTLRRRIKLHLPSGEDINDISFYYYIPRFIVREKSRLGEIDRKYAFDTFKQLVPLLKPQRVLFYGKSAYSEELSNYLKENNIAYDIILLRSDSVGVSSSQNNQSHGLNKLLIIKKQIQSNIDALPPVFLGAIDELFQEIDFMEATSAKSNASELQIDRRSRRTEFLKRIVMELVRIDRYMRMKDVVLLLNTNGFTTARGGAFVPYGRGIYKLIATTVRSLSLSQDEEDRELAREMELRFVRESDAEYTVSAALLATPLERKYGYKSESLNVSFAAVQEERKRVFGADIPSDYAAKSDLKD